MFAPEGLIPNRLATTRSTCANDGPRSASRFRLPNSPGAGIENAAGLSHCSPSLRYGLTPGTRLGRRTPREAPPPGVLMTAVQVAHGLLTTLPTASRYATSLRVTLTSSGTPLRPLRMVPTSQPPSSACSKPPAFDNHLRPLPIGIE